MIMGCPTCQSIVVNTCAGRGVWGDGITESKSIVYIARNNDVCLYSSLQSRHRLLLRICLVNVLRWGLSAGILAFAAEKMTDELE